jgi:rod shape-determining protein MreD
MATIIAIPIMVFLAMLQTVIVSRLPLLLGSADLILLTLIAWALQERVKNTWIWTLIGGLTMSILSALPLMVPLFGYLIATALARIVQNRIWQTPILAMYVTTLAGTLIYQGLVYIVLQFSGTTINIGDALNLVILPSLLLNMLLALPIHTIMVDLSQWVYPLEIKS